MTNNSDLIRKQFFDNYSSWVNSSNCGLSLDDKFQPVPWFCFEAIKFVKTFVEKKHHVFEFGCGSSTLFFANNCHRVISLESNQIWFEIISNNIVNQLKFNPGKTQNYYDKKNTICNSFLKNDKLIELYHLKLAIIEENYQKFLATLNIKFDLILIDSIKRYQCAVNSINYLNRDGIIILDDSERKNYQKIFDFF